MTRYAVLVSAGVLLVGCSDSRRTSTTSVSQPPAIRVSGAPNTIPVGTIVEVRTNEAINSTNAEGRTYNAEMAKDVVDARGRTLVPRGAPVELVVLETRERGGVRGAGLQLGMRSVTVDGKTYLVISNEVEKSSGLGRNRRTAEMVGGGAALGTLIGAASGGAKGGVIGGLIGAAAGAAAQVLTQGKEVRVPAETVLEFRVEEPLQLQPTP